MNTGKQDPANYRKMSEPIPSQEEANKQLAGFMEAVEKARNEFHMQDVHVIVKMNIINAQGNEQGALSSAHFGHELESAPMCAWSLGHAEADLKKIVGEYLRGA
jgi:hypothetical protein